MGVSLIAPGALLVAAIALVAGGGGLGGLGSLGQISSGPTLPDTGLPLSPEASLDEAQVATARLGPGRPAGPGRTDADPTRRFTRTGGGASQGLPGGPGGTITPAPRAPVSRPEVTGRVPVTPVSPTPVLQPPASPPAEPINDVADTTRELEPLPDEFRPTLEDIVDSIVNPQR